MTLHRSVLLRPLARLAGRQTVAAAAVLVVVLASCVDTTRVATCPVPPGERVKVCSAAGTRPAPDGLIDDFEDGDTAVVKGGDRSGSWFASHDPNGSTIDPAPLTMSDGGAGSSHKALHVVGRTASESGAWGVLWGANFVDGEIYDASNYAGVAFKAKVSAASTTKVRFKVSDSDTHPDGGVCKTCWNHFGKDLELTPDWQEYVVPFAEMKQEPGWGDRYSAIVPAKLFAINWSIEPGRTFDVWIDDVRFVDCR